MGWKEYLKVIAMAIVFIVIIMGVIHSAVSLEESRSRTVVMKMCSENAFKGSEWIKYRGIYRSCSTGDICDETSKGIVCD